MFKYKTFKKVASLSATIFLIGIMVFVIFEPVVVNAATTSQSVLTATVTSEITISSPGDTSFSATIPGVSGNPGAAVTASRTWTVITNNTSGFTLKLHASQAHALFLDENYYFSDYGLTPGTPAFGWSVPTGADARFGFSVAPATTTDIATAFLDNGSSSCGSGTYHASACWAGFNSTTDITAVDRSSPTDATGEAEVVNFKAESNARLLKSGDYKATITATVALNS